MADQFDALVGGVPSDAESQAALAAVLRRQSLLGQLGAASGDRVIAPLGEGLSSGALKAAQGIGGEREKQMALQQALTMHQDQMAHENSTLAESVRAHNLTDSRMREQNEIADRIRQQNADTAAARERDAAAKGQQGKPLPTGAGKDIETLQDSMRGVDDTLAAAKALDKAGVQLGGPGRNVKNWLSANTPLAGAQNDTVQNFWANYGRQFTLPELKATIGVRHNEYMQNLFESYHLNPNMSNEQLIQNLQQISDQGHARVRTRAKDYQSQGYDVGDLANEINPPAGPGAAGQSKAADIESRYAVPQAAPAPPAAPQAVPPPTASLFPMALGARQPGGMPLPQNSSMMAGLNG